MGIFTNSIWLTLFAIYFKYCNHNYPGENKFNEKKCGIAFKLALQSRQHWDYALKLSGNILFILAGLTLLADGLLYVLFTNNILLDGVRHLLSACVYFTSLFVFYFVVTSKLKSFQVNL